MSTSANLALPFIEGGELLPDVTLNETLRLLDSLVQLAIVDRDLATPPGSPTEGQRWIVKTGATGAWAGHVNHIAAWQDGEWVFSVPKTGWFAYLIDEGALIAWSGSAWVDALTMLSTLQNLALLGVGTTADATNPFSAKLNNTLWVAKTVAEGGDGHLRYKLSKESAAKTLSLLMQTNFSGRAELGLTGDDDFHFKVSADGSSWHDAITIDKSTGKLTANQGFTSPAATRAQLYAAPFDGLAFNGLQINGGMEVSQENGTSAVTASSGGSDRHVVDNWTISYTHNAGTAVITGQQVTPPGSPSFGGAFPPGLQLKSSTALSSPAAGDYAVIRTKIEGYRTSRLAFGGSAAQSVTIGFWVYATIAGTMAVSLHNSAVNRSIVQNVTISNAATWEYKTIAFAGDTSGTWLSTSGIGTYLDFCAVTGATWQVSNNAWTAALGFGTSSQTNFLASNNNVFCITGVVVLPGIELPAYDRAALIMRPYHEELDRCLRYFERRDSSEGANRPFGSGVCISTSSALIHLNYLKRKRTTPTIVLSAGNTFGAITSAGAIAAATSISATDVAMHGCLLVPAGMSGLTAGNGTLIYSNSTTSARIDVDARL